MKKMNLSDIPKQDPFDVPEGYLDRLPLSIQSKVTQVPAAQMLGSGSWLIMPKLQMAFTALLLLVVSVLVLRQPQRQEADAQAILEEISQQEVVNYLSTRGKLSIQELAIETNWKDASPYELHDLPGEDILEEEILQDLDTYTAEDLWK